MLTESVKISQTDMKKLLSAASPDSALLYLYIQSGNTLEQAEKELNLNPSRLNTAAATLRQLGLICDDRRCPIAPGERPGYSERDVLEAMEEDNSFRGLYGEVQRQLGKTLTTEELKILLGFVRYLGLPMDVIAMLVCYCKDRARQKGSCRTPSLRSIEKEAYAWAEQGIDSLEEAVAFIQNQNMRRSRLGQLLKILQIRGRNLTAGEEKYAQKWLDMGFSDEVIALAYERTCLNTGGLSWAYMNKILIRWRDAGFRTGADVRNGDRKAPSSDASGEFSAVELEAVRRIAQEG